MSFKILGDFNQSLAGHDLNFWKQRETFLDCRSRFLKISKDSFWGFNNTILTMSHDISKGNFGPMVERKAWVDDYAFVSSNCTIYNSWIKSNAIISCGSVLSSVVVPEHTIVQGNPARAVARYENGKWIKIDEELKRWE